MKVPIPDNVVVNLFCIFSSDIMSSLLGSELRTIFQWWPKQQFYKRCIVGFLLVFSNPTNQVGILYAFCTILSAYATTFRVLWTYNEVPLLLNTLYVPTIYCSTSQSASLHTYPELHRLWLASLFPRVGEYETRGQRLRWEGEKNYKGPEEQPRHTGNGVYKEQVVSRIIGCEYNCDIEDTWNGTRSGNVLMEMDHLEACGTNLVWKFGWQGKVRLKGLFLCCPARWLETSIIHTFPTDQYFHNKHTNILSRV